MALGRPPRDISGQSFGRLTALKLVETEPERKWLCACRCGATCIVLQKHLLSKAVKSCRCLMREMSAEKLRHRLLPEGVAFGNYLFSYNRRTALKRSLAWCLTKETYLVLIRKRCYYCGRQPVPLWNPSAKQANGERKFRGVFAHHGIDRKNNRVGYTTANSVPCCWQCNRAKGPTSSTQFRIWIRRVFKHLYEK